MIATCQRNILQHFWRNIRVVSRFLGRRFHPKSRQLFPFYFSNMTLRTDLQTFGVTGAVFKIAGEMRWLPAYFDNPEHVAWVCGHTHTTCCTQQCCSMLHWHVVIVWPALNNNNFPLILKSQVKVTYP